MIEKVGGKTAAKPAPKKKAAPPPEPEPEDEDEGLDEGEDEGLDEPEDEPAPKRKPQATVAKKASGKTADRGYPGDSICAPVPQEFCDDLINVLNRIADALEAFPTNQSDWING